MLRNQLNDALKSAMKDKDQVAVSTLRLILAAVKDRDIALRSEGGDGGIDDAAILQVLQTMIRQRRESIALYERGGRQELADREAEEITVVERFLPRQLDAQETADALDRALEETGAASVKDMGRVMALLRERYSGRMDFGQAGAALKARLTG